MENPNNNNLWYNKRLRRFAHENRSDMTKAEACLWKYVHQWEEIAENDRIREEALTAMGFTVMRFDDDDVLTASGCIFSLK